MSGRLLDPPPYGSPEWLLWRRGGLGASDLATVAGLNPWKGEYALALEKRGETDGDGESWPMAMGHLMEPVALATVDVDARGETWMDDRWPHLWATLDARRARIGIEAKWTTKRDAGIPAHWRVQALAQMGIADLTAVDFVRVTPYEPPTVVATIERDEQAIADLLELGEAWYVRYVLGDEMPPPDGSRESMRHLDTLRGDDAAQATEEQAALMAALKVVRGRMAEAERDEGRIVAALKASMAGIGSLTGPGFRVTWSAVKPRTVVDWKAVAEELRPDPALVERFTTVKEGTTSFRPSWDEEE